MEKLNRNTNYNELNDEELIALHRQGDKVVTQKAERTLFERWKKYAYKIGQNIFHAMNVIAKGVAENEAIIGLIEGLRNYPPKSGDFKEYIRASIKYTVLKEWKLENKQGLHNINTKKNPVNMKYLDDKYIVRRLEEEAVKFKDDTFTKVSLRLLLDKLSDRDRLVIELYYIEGMTQKEISKVINRDESRVHQIRNKSLMKLKELAAA